MLFVGLLEENRQVFIVVAGEQKLFVHASVHFLFTSPFFFLLMRF
jgi:hypothetical protein